MYGAPESFLIQARMEFNLVLRQFSAGFAMFFGFAILVGAAESVWSERERDTWSGLIATPFTGWEILRAKMLGALYRLRGGVAVLVGLWAVGMMSGAVHPIGFLLTLAAMIGVSGCFATIGVYVSLAARNRDAALNLNALIPFLLALAGLAIGLQVPGSVLLAAVSPPFLVFTSLFSYEDVHRFMHSGVLPTYTGAASPQPNLNARWVLAACLLGTVAYIAAFLTLLRVVSLRFDEIVGRPTQRRTDPIRIITKGQESNVRLLQPRRGDR